MVKPPKTMQPEGIGKDYSSLVTTINLQEDVTHGHNKDNDNNQKKKKKEKTTTRIRPNPHRGMGEDSFRHYMARKITLQRQQFGIQQHLPPSPSNGNAPTWDQDTPEEETLSPTKRRKVWFQQDIEQQQQQQQQHSLEQSVDQGLTNLIQRLKRKHGLGKKRKQSLANSVPCHSGDTKINYMHRNESDTPTSSSTSTSIGKPLHKRHRPDQFFQGIVIMINGFTDPDNETLQRMLHRHGGDLEKYETIRLTHIVASQLSFAKAKIYRKMKKPIPVVLPQWIVDCVKQQKLLPHGPYLLEQLKEKGTASVKTYFGNPPTLVSSKTSLTEAPVTRMSIVPFKHNDVDQSTHSDSTMDEENMDDSNTSFHHYTQQQQQDVSFHGEDSLWLHTQVQETLQKSFATDHIPLEEPMSPSFVKLSPPKHNMDSFSLAEQIHSRPQPSGTCSFQTVPVQLFQAEDNDEHDSFKPCLHDCKSTLQSSNQDDKNIIPSCDDHDQLVLSPSSVKVIASIHEQDDTLSQQSSPLIIQEVSESHSQAEQTNNEEMKPALSMPELSSGLDETALSLSVENCRNECLGLNGRTDTKFIHGKLRTTGTDPDFLESFFQNSRLSFIGSFQQRARASSRNKSSARTNPLITSVGRRFVLHVDMDCFFAAVVLRNYPQHRNKPVAISHCGSNSDSSLSTDSRPISKKSSSECATCNYEARKYGIKKGMFLGRAKELCPSLVVLPYDFEGYEEVSEQVAEILYKYAAEYEGAVEQVSCDEAYVELHQVECSDEGSIHETIRRVGEEIRQEIFTATQCTATIGIGANKLLAKLGTDKAKPDGCFVVQDYRDLLGSLKVRELPGIGYSAERKLASEGILSVKDVWDFGEQAESTLSRILGSALGKKILAFCHGEDGRQVKPADRKTIGAECNYGVRFDGPYGVDHLINGLAKEVEKRMDGVGVTGSKLTLKVKQRKAGAKEPPKFLGHGSCHSLSRSIDIPGRIPINDSNIFARLGMQLFQELGIDDNDVRGMGIVISKLSSKQGITETLPDGQRKSWFPIKSNVDAPHTPTVVEKNVIDCDGDGMSLVENGFENEGSASNGLSKQSMVTLCDITHNDIHDDPIEDDLDLPPHSQIHISQVMALPSPLKRKISQILEMRQAIVVDDIEEFDPLEREQPSSVSSTHQWKQTSVKSLFKLAAVKSGKDTLSGPLGGSVSLTQLECLPLDMQLELADGNVQVGFKRRDSSMSSRKHIGRPKALFPKEANGVSTAGSKSGEPERSQTDEEIDEPGVPNPNAFLSFMGGRRRSFYLDNVAPLKGFLDENDPRDEDAINHVITFLGVCIAEGRLHEVVKLLRSIKNRCDDWSIAAYNDLLQKVDASILETTGCSLDRNWLRL